MNQLSFYLILGIPDLCLEKNMVKKYDIQVQTLQGFLVVFEDIDIYI